MPFVKAKCTECDAPLVVDPSLKRAKCDHCGTPYLIQDAINYYHYYISGWHGTADFDTSELTSEMKMELGAAEAVMKMQRYEDALNRFELLSNRIPQEYRVWWGQIRALTRELTAPIENKADILTLCGLYDSMMHFIPSQKCDEIKQQFMSYIQTQDQMLEKRIRDMRQRKNDLETENAEIRRKLEVWKYSKYQTSEQSAKILEVVILVGLALGVFGKSLVLLGTAGIGCLLYYTVLIPKLENDKAEWERGKAATIQELSERCRDNEQELSQIEETLSKLM